MRAPRAAFLLSTLLFLPIAVSAATSFPDVPPTSSQYEAIMKLTELGVIGGNPDGTFRPKNAVNRAAMLKMLYKASGNFPDVAKLGCFAQEFKSEAWFAPYVCDALARGHVKGYADGKFRPENPVTLAEAVKMTFAVFAIPQPDLASVSVAQIPNVPADAWFHDYIYGAAYLQILPLPGQTLVDTYPNDPLSRDQAASLVYAAWKLRKTLDAAAQPPPPPPPPPVPAAASSSAASSVAGVPYKSQAELKTVAFPFQEQWKFSDRNSISYNFSLAKTTVVDIAVTLGAEAKVQCRLSRIESDGFVLEYHPGYQEGNRCLLLTTLGAGTYQLYLQPELPNAPFTVAADSGKGFGNDGIPEARQLIPGQYRTDFLGVNDLENWYKFSVAGAPDEGKKMRVDVTGTSVTPCLIFPWSDVDVYGFVVPPCNQDAPFTDGTYYVRIGHGAQRGVKQTYTVRVQ